MSKFDHIIIGAGIEGSWTAYHLAKKGYKVLLLEQFTLPHSRGSSHGQTRITRYGYVEDFHTALMDEAFSKWRQLEKDADVQLFVETGGLYVARKKAYKDLDSLISNLSSQTNAIYKPLKSEEIERIFPQGNFGKAYRGCWEKNAGVLFADKCLSAVQKMFKQSGGTLIDGFEVHQIEPGPTVTVRGVKTSKWTEKNPVNEPESFLANNIIVCTGPWSGSFIKKTLGLHLPLTARRINIFYWKVKDLKKGSLPVIFIDLSDSGDYYSLPSLEYPNMVKIGCLQQEIADPNSRDTAHRRINFKKISNYVREHFPTLESRPAIIETCMYTVTPDEVCILDKHPQHGNIIIGCGFSGTGFKISPVVAHILGNMAEGKEPVHNIKPFSLSRFNNNDMKAKL